MMIDKSNLDRIFGDDDLKEKFMRPPGWQRVAEDTKKTGQDPLSSQQTVVSVVNPKSRSVAVALALFLGGIGVHKFYLNRPDWGILYVLFFWTLIPLPS